MKKIVVVFAAVGFAIIVASLLLSGMTEINQMTDISFPPTELRQYMITTVPEETTTTTLVHTTTKPTTKTTATATVKPTTVTATTKTVTTTTTKATTTTSEAATTTESRSYTDDELEMMAIVIYREAGGDAYSNRTRIMVGNVVMNRVRSSQFPNTIYGVLTQRGQYAGMSGAVTWPSMASNRWEQNAVARARECAKRVLAGENYLPSNVVYQSDYSYLGSGVYCVSDGMYFNYA